ncbi:unnamed protein product [Callosobruchus maculatus]|uniref:Uncharacterized protein n=1 Tax=Callosobruchus maculatus TaxID=64391 RepID=A0A653DHN9_CALMS|nr:unnamed protein product [Callosobruchus maculatus]
MPLAYFQCLVVVCRKWCYIAISDRDKKTSITKEVENG